MGKAFLIMGKSGSGKSTSLRNFKKDEVCLINVTGKPMPFKGKFENEINTDDYREIMNLLSTAPAKIIVIDDAGYLITNQFMRGHGATGKGSGNAIFSLYNEIANNFWVLLEHIKNLPNDVTVYIVMHEEKSETGDVKPKTLGKLLDEKVCLEGLFTVVLRSTMKDGKYYFETQSNGFTVSKSPIGMFDEELIDNDLNNVDKTIRSYYSE